MISRQDSKWISEVGRMSSPKPAEEKKVGILTSRFRSIEKGPPPIPHLPPSPLFSPASDPDPLSWNTPDSTWPIPSLGNRSTRTYPSPLKWLFLDLLRHGQSKEFDLSQPHHEGPGDRAIDRVTTSSVSASGLARGCRSSPTSLC